MHGLEIKPVLGSGTVDGDLREIVGGMNDGLRNEFDDRWAEDAEMI